MKALSIRQPWAWLIIRPDIIGDEARALAAQTGLLKGIENRDWRTALRGRIYIHASKGLTRAEYDQAVEYVRTVVHASVEIPPLAELERGGIIGEAEITDCVNDSCSWWFNGEFGFVLANAKPLPFRPCRGMLKFFEVPNARLSESPTKTP